MFTVNELQRMANLVIAGAKSPATGADAIMDAAILLQRIQQEAGKIQSAEAEAANERTE